MEFSLDEKYAIAGRARTIHERLVGPSNEVGNNPPIDPEKLRDEWADHFPDEATFIDRLHHEGFTESAVLDQLAATDWPSTEPLPGWIDELEAIAYYVGQSQPDGQDSVAISEDTPFVEVLTTFIAYAKLQAFNGDCPPNGVSQLEQWLGTRLEQLCVRALYVEFKAFIEYHDPELAATNPNSTTNPGTMYYKRFIESIFDGGFRTLCFEYPVLARHLVQMVEQWTATVQMVFQRIDDDRDTLEERFNIAGDLMEIEPLANDAHHGGQVPMRISFESGTIIYKPRPIDTGMALYTILERLNEYLETPIFESPTYLSRDGYGWMGLIHYHEPKELTAAERYYERVGILLCVTYILDVPDCQFENLIVSGEQPMLIDAETLLHPYIEPAASAYDTAVLAASKDSILRTALLP